MRIRSCLIKITGRCFRIVSIPFSRSTTYAMHVRGNILEQKLWSYCDFAISRNFRTFFILLKLVVVPHCFPVDPNFQFFLTTRYFDWFSSFLAFYSIFDQYSCSFSYSSMFPSTLKLLIFLAKSLNYLWLRYFWPFFSIFAEFVLNFRIFKLFFQFFYTNTNISSSK